MYCGAKAGNLGTIHKKQILIAKTIKMFNSLIDANLIGLLVALKYAKGTTTKVSKIRTEKRMLKKKGSKSTNLINES